MKFAHDVPGYVQGHRFSQDRRYYDSVNARFHDLAGYSRFGNYCDKTSGTPAFSNHGANNREGLLLDNSNQWRFPLSIPWEGTMLLVVKPSFGSSPGTAQTLYTWLFGDAPTTTVNAHINLFNGGPPPAIKVNSSSAQATSGFINTTNSSLLLLAFSTSQSDRKVRYTQDGTTVTASAAASGTTNGNAVAMGIGGSGSTDDNIYVRLGNNSGTLADTAANATDKCYVFEQHFFKGDQLTDNLPAMKEFIDTLRTYYGI